MMASLKKTTINVILTVLGTGLATLLKGKSMIFTDNIFHNWPQNQGGREGGREGGADIARG